MRLEKLYLNLLESRGDFDGDFNASKTHNKQFRVAIDKEGNPTILIDESSSNVTSQAYRLKHIEIKPSVHCHVRDIDNNAELRKNTFTTIKLLNFNSHLLNYFFLLIEHVIYKLSKDNYKTSVKIEIERLVDLFSKSGKVDINTAVGLWGELFFIELSENTSSKINDWHLDKRNSLDFSHGDNHYSEIKTTLSGKREHKLSLKQLKRYSESSVRIISIMTEKSSNGFSIGDLVNSILEKVDNAEIRDKLIDTVNETLEGDVEVMNSLILDYDFAVTNYKDFDMNNFPRLDITLPKFITDAKFNINFDAIT